MPTDVTTEIETFGKLPIERDRDQFLRELIGELSGTLEDVVGIEEASGLISLVGGRIGDLMNRDYCAALGVAALSPAQVAAAFVDLKRRIEGGFTVESVDDDKIVLKNTACPFGKAVEGRGSLCMMTSSVFGRLAAENLGYGKVALEQTIAEGHAGCRAVVYLRQSDEAERADGREYFSIAFT